MNKFRFIGRYCSAVCITVCHFWSASGNALAQDSSGNQAPSLDSKTSIGPAWLDWRGNLSIGNWSGDRLLDDQHDFGLAQLQLNITANFDRAWSFRGNTNLSYMRSIHADTESVKKHIYLRDAYLKWDAEQMEWRIGTQIFSWGRADRLNPTDQLSARDFRSPHVNDEEQKLGNFASSWSQDVGMESRLQMVIQAVSWGQGQVPSAQQESSLPLAPLHRHFDYAIKFDHIGTAFDWSLSYFDGVEKVRSLELVQQQGHLLGMQRRYAPLQSVGADMASTHGDWSMRGELAYLRFKPANIDKAGRLTHWYGVLGVENNLTSFSSVLSNASFSLQYFFRRFQDDPRFNNFPSQWRSSVANLQVANNQFHRWQDGYTLRFAQRLINDQLDYEIVAVANARDHDYALRPRLNYRSSDSTKWVFGCDLFRGKDHSFFGSLRKNSLAFTEFVLIF